MSIEHYYKMSELQQPKFIQTLSILSLVDITWHRRVASDGVITGIYVKLFPHKSLRFSYPRLP